MLLTIKDRFGTNMVYSKGQLVRVYRDKVYDEYRGYLNVLFSELGCVVSCASYDEKGKQTAEWLEYLDT